jgi:EAL domain-containing protein (putative c-di-GMP-specific phosphodiesterase class I)
MLELDLWVIENVFEWIGANRPLFDTLGGFAINLSASSLRSSELYERLSSLLAEADFPTAKIVFEITESTAIERYGVVQDFMRGLRQYGSRFCLDDFGTGFTSYAHLKNLRADTLKIDGSFVRDMLASEADFAMVRSMNDLAHSLGLATVAEYVESTELIEALKVIGVDYGQGYAIHKPCRIDELSLAAAHGVAGPDSRGFGSG